MAKFDPKTGERLDPENDSPKAPAKQAEPKTDETASDAKPKK